MNTMLWLALAFAFLGVAGSLPLMKRANDKCGEEAQESAIGAILVFVGCESIAVVLFVVGLIAKWA